MRNATGASILLRGAVSSLFVLGTIASLSTSGSSQPGGATGAPLPLGSMAPTKTIASGQEFFKGASYVGAEACRRCHPQRYEEWGKTWHAKMEQRAGPGVVVGDFNNVTLVYENVEVASVKHPSGKETLTVTLKLTTAGGKYYVTLVDQDDERNNQTYEIVKTLGGKWDQGYEVQVDDHYVPAPIRWSSTVNAWLAKGFLAGDWFVGDGTPDGVPRRPDQLPASRRAEAKCTMCHTTGFMPVFDPAVKGFRAAGPYELGVSCEKCHGPGSLHVKEADEAAGKGQTLGATTIVQPVKDLTALQQDLVCAQCHGGNTNRTEPDLDFPVGYLPGDTDLASRVFFWSHSGHPNAAHAAYFWPNDWAMRNRQQWQDFRRSAHFNKTTVTCLTCHTFHGEWSGAQLRLPRDQLCRACHTESGFAKRPNVEFYADSPMAKAGVTCVDCHMAKIAHRTLETTKRPPQWDTTSHTFMVATPELAARYGMRNACEDCHSAGSARGPRRRTLSR